QLRRAARARRVDDRVVREVGLARIALARRARQLDADVEVDELGLAAADQRHAVGELELGLVARGQRLGVLVNEARAADLEAEALVHAGDGELVVDAWTIVGRGRDAALEARRVREVAARG